MKSFDIFLFMKTGTKINKTRGRKGSLLILVMVIMAVALILITSAMTITVAARSHYNKVAVMDQSHLTAMSGAKLIGDAVQKGTITTAQLELMASSTTPTKYYLTGSSSVAPGLAGTSSSSSSYTTAEFGYSNAVTKDYITVKVTTHIENTAVTDSATDESATLFLKKTPVVIPDGFGAAIAINGSGLLPNISFGYDAVSKNAKSNFIIVTGSSTTPLNGNGTYDTDVVVLGTICFGNVTNFNKDFVLLGKNANIYNTGNNRVPTMTSAGSFGALVNSTDTKGSVFTGQTYAYGFNGTDLKTAGSIILNNSVMKIDDVNNPPIIGTSNYTANNGAIILKSGGTATTNTFNTAANTFVDKYMNPNGRVQKSLSFVAPVDRAALMNQLLLSPTYATMSTAQIISKLQTDESAVQIVLNSSGTVTNYIDKNSANVSLSQPLQGSAYIINTSAPSCLGQALTFDLTNNNITLYIVGNSTLKFDKDYSKNPATDGSIRFIRPSGSGNIGRIVFMQDSASFDLGYNGTLDNFAGITGAGTDPARYSKTPATITDGSEPYLYVYGFNNNITVNSPKFLEGYYGLYGSGTFTIGTQYFDAYYARVNCKLMTISGGNAVKLPYCPAPGEGTDSTTNKNKYQISGYITN